MTSISFFLAPEAPKKSPTFDDTNGSENKKPTEITTRSRNMVDRGQVAKIQNVSEEETISMMKEYIEKVEKRAAEQENKENEKKREIRKKKEEQVQELIRMYSKKSTTKIIEPEKKGEILKELLQQYGKQKKEISSNTIAKDQKLAPESTDMKLKTTPRKISVSPRSQLHFSSTSTDSFEARNQDQEKDPTREKPESPESFNRKSSRPRPTTLKITLNYETDCDAITLD